MALLVFGLFLVALGPANVLVAANTINYGLRWQNSLLLASGILFLVGGAFEFFLGMLGATLGREAGHGLSLMIFSSLILVMTVLAGVLFVMAQSFLTRQSGALVMAGISVVLLVIIIMAANLGRKACAAIAVS